MSGNGAPARYFRQMREVARDIVLTPSISPMQGQASPHTISSYRDTFHQFLKFTEQRLRKEPSRLVFQEIDAPLITTFLDHLEKHQGLSTRSRNLRLTALRSFFRFAAFEAPTHSA